MKRILILTAITVGAVTVVLLTALINADQTRYNNDFVRIFPSHAADIRAVLKLPENRFFLAGVSDEQIYLRDRLGMLLSTPDLADTTRVNVDMPFGAEVMIDSPYFFIHYGPEALLQRGHLVDWAVDTTVAGISGFTAIQPISPAKAVMRRMNVGKRQSSLIKSNGSQQYVLKKQVDGLLCTDGFLEYASEINQLVYIYRYRNQFIFLDTMLNEVRHGRTIDTTSVAKISVAEIDGKIKMSKPPVSVNKNACVDGNYLFIQSNLVARNESPDRAKNQNTIDVYNIHDSSYLFSFYIENYGDSKLLEFEVKGSILVAVFKDAVATYDLSSTFLP